MTSHKVEFFWTTSSSVVEEAFCTTSSFVEEEAAKAPVTTTTAAAAQPAVLLLLLLDSTLQKNTELLLLATTTTRPSSVVGSSSSSSSLSDKHNVFVVNWLPKITKLYSSAFTFGWGPLIYQLQCMMTAFNSSKPAEMRLRTDPARSWPELRPCGVADEVMYRRTCLRGSVTSTLRRGIL